MKNPHDNAYKLLFSRKEIVVQLLKYFIDEDFVKDLDFDSLVKINKTFVRAEFQDRESDIIYQINFKNKPIYIYLLIELQSTVNYLMPLRFLEYICAFYQDLIKNQLKIKLFPAVFPVLFYNGENKWTAKTNINELIEQSIPKKYIPNFSYYKVCINEFSDETLAEIDNTLSFIFSFEKSEPKMIFDNLDKLFRRIEKEYPKLREEIKNWLNYFFRQQNVNFRDIIDSKITEIEEIKTVLTSAWEKDLKESFDKGIKEGKLEGIKEGELRGKLEGIKEGKLEGIKDKEKEIIITSYIDLKLDIKQIALIVKSDSNYVQKILKDNGIL